MEIVASPTGEARGECFPVAKICILPVPQEFAIFTAFAIFAIFANIEHMHLAFECRHESLRQPPPVFPLGSLLPADQGR